MVISANENESFGFLLKRFAAAAAVDDDDDDDDDDDELFLWYGWPTEGV